MSVPDAALSTRPSQYPSPHSSAAPAADAADAPPSKELPSSPAAAAPSAGGCSPDRLRAAPSPVEATDTVRGAHVPPPATHDACADDSRTPPEAGSWPAAELDAAPAHRAAPVQSTCAEDRDTADGPAPGCSPSSTTSGPDDDRDDDCAPHPPSVTRHSPDPLLVRARPSSNPASEADTLVRTEPEHSTAPATQSNEESARAVLTGPPTVAAGSVSHQRTTAGAAPVVDSERAEHPPARVSHSDDPDARVRSPAPSSPDSTSNTGSPAPLLTVRVVPAPSHPSAPSQSTVTSARLVVSVAGPADPPRPGHPACATRGAESDETSAPHRPSVTSQSASPVVERCTGSAPSTATEPDARVCDSPDPEQPASPAQSTPVRAWARPSRSSAAISLARKAGTGAAAGGSPVSAAAATSHPPAVTVHSAVPDDDARRASGVLDASAPGAVDRESPSASTLALPVHSSAPPQSTVAAPAAGVWRSPAVASAVTLHHGPSHSADASASPVRRSASATPVSDRSPPAVTSHPGPVQSARASEPDAAAVSRQSPSVGSHTADAAPDVSVVDPAVVPVPVPAPVSSPDEPAFPAHRREFPSRVQEADARSVPEPTDTPQDDTPASARQSSCSIAGSAPGRPPAACCHTFRSPVPSPLFALGASVPVRSPAFSPDASVPDPSPAFSLVASVPDPSPGARPAQDANAPLVVQPAAVSPSRCTPVSCPVAAASRSVSS
ncbi:hypothetical protein BG845_02710 [Pseudonocardia autotrophica]|uniref:Uncharacterized protein n=1 Tax=Pseudonocardia autotrophica TaxID=2074 RepID=A0A1Y2MZP7_PSEAH|nr:hypothetical protein BG845_02710 [Pseudonocardia autotrophica]